MCAYSISLSDADTANTDDEPATVQIKLGQKLGSSESGNSTAFSIQKTHAERIDVSLRGLDE